ncbi:MAG: hypothetical protein ABR903_09185 [Thermodesulfovibrionales bacterium]
MAEPVPPRSSAMLFERNDALVVEAFRRGDFDYLEGVSEVSEADFFRAITAKKVLGKLAATYPSPCQKHDVPLWVYIAGDISMRFHGVHQFHAFPYVVRSGGMVNAFGPEMGQKATHPETGDVTLSCVGFNNKNEYDRQTPCDQDHLRKMAKKTDAGLLTTWFNRDVVGIFKQHHAFDPEGIFIGDASYLFVPDNDKYEGSSRMLFDEHNHPVESKNLTTKERARYRWRRCYKLVSLIHTNRSGDFFLYAAQKVVAGKEHECPLLYRLVEQFVEFHGKGIIKKLILDRGFLDGHTIGRCKQEWSIDVLIPASRRHPAQSRLRFIGLSVSKNARRPGREPSPCAKHKPLQIQKRLRNRWFVQKPRSLQAFRLLPPVRSPWMSSSTKRSMPMAASITGCCFPRRQLPILSLAAVTMPCVPPLKSGIAN